MLSVYSNKINPVYGTTSFTSLRALGRQRRRNHSLRATAGKPTAIARLSHCICLSVCLSIRPSHGWISQKRCK